MATYLDSPFTWWSQALTPAAVVSKYNDEEVGIFIITNVIMAIIGTTAGDSIAFSYNGANLLYTQSNVVTGLNCDSYSTYLPLFGGQYVEMVGGLVGSQFAIGGYYHTTGTS